MSQIEEKLKEKKPFSKMLTIQKTRGEEDLEQQMKTSTQMQSTHMAQLVQGLFTADPEARYAAVQIVLGSLDLQAFIPGRLC